MRVARKHTVALMIGILAVMAGYAYWQIRQEVVLFNASAERRRLLGMTILISLEQIWLSEGEARVRDVVERANKTVPQLDLRLILLDAAAGDVQPSLSDEQLAQLRAGQMVQFTRPGRSGEPLNYTYVALSVAGRRPAVLELTEAQPAELKYIRMGHWAIFFATLAIAAICGLIATMLDGWLIGRPLQRLRDKLRRAGEGDFSQPLRLPQRDEIGELARDVNAMCDRIAEANRKLAEEMEARIVALEQLRHTDRLATVGQLAAGVAHELGTPLNVVSARAQLIGGAEMAPPEVVKNAQIIVEQSDRMTEIIQQLLDFSRRRGAKLGLCSLDRIVTRTLDLLSSVAQHSRVMLHYDGPAGAMLARVDQNQIQQALTNIVLNGIQAMPGGGDLRVRIDTRRARRPTDPSGREDDYVCIVIDDTGQGIPPEQSGRIFEPFFTTKAVGEGTGLGLAVAHGIVAEHGGWIAVDSTVGTGTRFSIFLPAAAESPAREAEVAS